MKKNKKTKQKKNIILLIQQFFSLELYSSDPSGNGANHLTLSPPERERETEKKKTFLFPLFSPHIKDFQTYQQGRVWQYSLVPVIDQMSCQAEHGSWSFGDSSLALLVHVLSLAPCLLPSILPGQHQDRVLVHYPEIEFMTHLKSVCSKTVTNLDLCSLA